MKWADWKKKKYTQRKSVGGGGGLVARSCPTLEQPTRVLCPWDFPRKNTGVDENCLLFLPFYFLLRCSCLTVL